jgi:polysaccharide export outer membrane protein
MINRFFLAAALLTTPAFAAAQSAETSKASSTAQPTTSAAPNVSARYVLGAGDEIVIHALDAPEISEKPQKLDPDGDLRLAIIGRVHAAGMNVSDLEAELTNRLGVFLQQPDVTVTVTGSRSQAVSLMGAVTTPGLKPITTGNRLMDVLSAAGGLTADAGPVVRIVRRTDQGTIPLPGAKPDPTGEYQVAEMDARALFDGLAPETNIEIMANDVVTVPRAQVVYVIGEVGKPGSLQLASTHGMTVMEAVSSSGGGTRTASMSKSRILRRVPGQAERQEIPVNLEEMMQGKVKDVTMQVGDILVVPDATAKRVTAKILETAVQAGIFALIP